MTENETVSSRVHRGVRALGLVIVVLAIVLAFIFYRFYIKSNLWVHGMSATSASGADAGDWDSTRKMQPSDWSVFQSDASASGAPSASALSSRFRLAGVFFGYAKETTTGAPRRALVADTLAGAQILVSEGDLLEPGTVRVARIEADAVTLVSGTQSVRLTMGWKDSDKVPSAPSAAPTSAPAPASRPGSRFGERTADGHWALKRDALMAYYNELKDEPERIALLYETFKPVYVDGRITGYRIGIEGEGDFLEAMGLKENDVMRTVNNLDMTSQRRAEFFIREFVQGRVNSFDLEFERDGRAVKQVYGIQ